MSGFTRRVALLTGAREESFERLAGGDLSEVLRLRRADGRDAVAKGGPMVAIEAAMLRALAGAGIPTPAVEGEHDGVLLIDHVANDAVFSANAWADVGRVLRKLHDQVGEEYGWPANYRLGTVEMDNKAAADWPSFFGEQRLVSTASLLDRPWRERIDRLAARLPDLLPPAPPPAWLHGDLWTGNILVRDGRVAALIDPACYRGDAEVDLAMLTLFDTPADSFWDSYGAPEPGWEQRRAVYQLFPALVHLRLFGASYAGMVDRLLEQVGG